MRANEKIKNPKSIADCSVPKLICLVGMDGSGKTTHAKRLAYELKNSGRKCKYVWFREPFFLSFPFMAICRIFNFTDTSISSEGRTYSVHKYHKEPIASLWPWLRLVDLMFWIVWKIYVPVLEGLTVICDRFIHDILIDTMMDVNDTSLNEKLVGKLMLRLIPTFSKVVLLDISVSEASKRKNEPFYLPARRLGIYKTIARDLKIPVVDTNPSFNIAHNDLARAILQVNKVVQES